MDNRIVFSESVSDAFRSIRSAFEHGRDGVLEQLADYYGQLASEYPPPLLLNYIHNAFAHTCKEGAETLRSGADPSPFFVNLDRMELRCLDRIG